MDQTQITEWQGNFYHERLSSWPEECNLLNLPGLEHMEGELDPDAQCEEQAAKPEGLNTDGADNGPAPMQSGERSDGTVGGVHWIYHPTSWK
jgi:hypothetical protein